MNLSYKRSATVLVATIACDGSAKTYEAKEIDWKHGWKFRCQISVTATQPGYGLGQSSPDTETLHDDLHRGVWKIASHDGTVRVEFAIPDSLDVLRDSGSIGSAIGGPVAIAGRRHHCQALLYAKNSDGAASLKLLPRRSGIVFLPSSHHLYWPDLDIDLAVESLTHPERYPLISQAQPTKPSLQPTKAGATPRPKRGARKRLRG
jgi:hypothetical protein